MTRNICNKYGNFRSFEMYEYTLAHVTMCYQIPFDPEGDL